MKRLGRVHTRPPGVALCVKGLGRVHKGHSRPRGARIICTEIGQSPRATLAVSWGGTVCVCVCEETGPRAQVTYAASWGETYVFEMILKFCHGFFFSTS